MRRRVQSPSLPSHEACPPHSLAGIVANMTASTVAQYLAALPADRRAALSAVRKAINENLPDGYEEGMQFGMIGWYVPLSVYPAGYGENPKVLSVSRTESPASLD